MASGGAGSLRVALGHRAVARRLHETTVIVDRGEEGGQECAGSGRSRRRSSLEADTTFLEEVHAKEGDTAGSRAPDMPNAPSAPQPPAWGPAPLDLGRGQSVDSINSLATVVPENASLPDSPSSVDEKENRGFVQEQAEEDAASGRQDSTMATNLPSPGGVPPDRREVLSTLSEGLTTPAEDGDESAAESGDEGDSRMAITPKAQKSERDMVEELLNSPDSTQLADRILAQHLISHPAPLKRFDSADAAMEMAQRQQQRRLLQQQHSKDHPGEQRMASNALPPPPPVGATPAPPFPPGHGASPFCAFTKSPASPQHAGSTMEDWCTESDGTDTTQTRGGGGGFVDVPLSVGNAGVGSGSGAPGIGAQGSCLKLSRYLEPIPMMPKYERFDSADYWMNKDRNDPGNAGSSSESATPSASDFRALEEKLRLHELRSHGQKDKDMQDGSSPSGREQWMEMDMGKDPMSSSPATTPSLSESDGESPPVTRMAQSTQPQLPTPGTGSQAAAHFLLNRRGRLH